MPRPKSTIHRMFRVRLDFGVGDEPGDGRVLEFLRANCDRWLLVHHITTTENPHYHWYCETVKQQSNFSMLLKKHFEVSGAAYSCKSADPARVIEYYSYLFNTKHGNESRCVHYEGFSPLDIATYKENAGAIAREFDARQRKGHKTQFDAAQEVWNEIEQCIDSDRNLGSTMLIETIYDHTIACLKRNHMMARPNHVKDIIATVLSYSSHTAGNATIKSLTLKFFIP